MKAILALADGRTFEGAAFGAEGEACTSSSERSASGVAAHQRVCARSTITVHLRGASLIGVRGQRIVKEVSVSVDETSYVAP